MVFFAVIYLQRNINQKSGGFFVEGFHEGVTSLSESQEQTHNGNLSWIDKIAYHSNRVIGSSACWRNKKKEVHSWINYHTEKGHGMPSFFTPFLVPNVNGQMSRGWLLVPFSVLMISRGLVGHLFLKCT